MPTVLGFRENNPRIPAGNRLSSLAIPAFSLEIREILRFPGTTRYRLRIQTVGVRAAENHRNDVPAGRGPA
jgi:hypothetical protein